MPSMSTVELAAAAVLVEAAVGYPPFLYRAIGHPVTWMGQLLSVLENRMNSGIESFFTRRRLGVVALAILLTVCLGVTFFLRWFISTAWFGLAVTVLVSTSMIAQRSLYDHVRAVADALEREGLAAGRKAVSMIVGRNPDQLDEAGVARAAIESLAENFSDGIVAPVFWMAVAGLPGAVAYKAVNTGDSMIGHRTPRFEAFGWAAARLDDLLNLPASRLSALFIAVAAFFTGGSLVHAVRAVARDASRHRSPNAGWPEAAMAGALGLQLAGPRVYGDELVVDAFMGDGRREATAADIRKALGVFIAACVVQWLVLAGLVLLTW
ncbi:MAG TPA: adenosylcobinamide-phosphate synthase CbiB [Alphaproteobacteria bacterium]|nr:adenosylcobinamide-phosphate synthase CbiB [Alphaproteobacteria bacterium]